ncbi:MAG TPA: zinc ribbon domain-containing protein [Blastocatellia bacterium]
MVRCANCGTESQDTGKFCRNCGSKLQPESGQPNEAATWRLEPDTNPGSDRPATSPVAQGNTGQTPPTTGPAYVPPSNYYQPLEQFPVSPAAPSHPEYFEDSASSRRKAPIQLGDWLYGGWRIYSENWALMTMASLLGAFLSACTVGLLAGPMMLGLFRMAFKTMKQERPEMSDLFAWEGKFLPAVVVTLIFAVLWLAVPGVGSGHELLWIFGIALHPLLSIGYLLTLPTVSEGRADLAAAINSIGRLIFSKDALMWWVVGLAFLILSGAGIFACGLGIFVTFPWIVCAAAVAYSALFGIDDPNRTLR